MAHGREVHDEVEARRCLLAAKRADRAGEWARAHGIDGRSLHAWLVNLERGGAFAPRRLERSSQSSHALGERVPDGPRGVPGARYVLAVADAGGVRRQRLGDDVAPGARGSALVLSLPPTVRVFVAVDPLDMRGSFDALAGAVRRLGLDPVDGQLYLFLNKRRRIAKAL